MRAKTILYMIVVSTIFFSLQCKQEFASKAHIEKISMGIDDNRLINADQNPENWLSYGRNYAEDRYSSLNQITKENVNELGLIWSLNLGTRRGIEATPIVVDGIMYLTGPWSKVFAVNTRTGKLIWTYDPGVPGAYGEKACCDVVNRGVAIYKGHIFLGTLDGRLISLDAATGNPSWEILTVDTTKAYTITGAPRIVDGKVMIGNGGAEYDARGYITAYDAMSGEQVWRFYTVPGDPSKPFESKALEMAAKTWTGEWWKYGGGGTVWDAMAYDPDLKLLYIGTGNGTPWDRLHRSPGGGDNLFLSSILAINPDNGELVWYYQTTPGDTWDFTATQHLILADMEIEDRLRKVIMQAPKNGFFYVLDRTDGELLSAEAYTYLNWATEVDKQTGRPVETEFARYKDENVFISPGPIGGHNWQPMAFNPETKLVYLPAHFSSMPYGHDSNWKFNKGKGYGSGSGWNISVAFDPAKPFRFDQSAPSSMPKGRLIAWDPVKQQEVWGVDLISYWNGGVLTTATGLVFHGTADGRFVAYDAHNGKILWESAIGSGIIAPPITYAVDGKQYVSIAVGWGGFHGLSNKYTKEIRPGTVFTFAIDGQAAFHDFDKTGERRLLSLDYSTTQEENERGQTLYRQYCNLCHGEVGGGGGVISDLAYSNNEIFQIYDSIVLKGLFQENGMPNFGDRLDKQDIKAIQGYILQTVKSVKEKQSQ